VADYSSLATLKAELRITDTTDDTRIARIITAASRAVDGLCNVPDNAFNTLAGTRYFDVLAKFAVGNRYVIDIDPLLSATLVATDDNGAGTWPTTWTVNTDYTLLPINAGLDGYPYRQLRTVPSGKAMTVGAKMLKITGNWGYSATTPPVIEEATVLQAIRWFKRPDAPFGVAGTQEMGFVRISADPDVEAILKKAGYIASWTFA
jgi:hypothetical protein